MDEPINSMSHSQNLIGVNVAPGPDIAPYISGHRPSSIPSKTIETNGQIGFDSQTAFAPSLLPRSLKWQQRRHIERAKAAYTTAQPLFLTESGMEGRKQRTQNIIESG